ncbi:hypothetical protein TD95_002371 [Thielaviopsis punctulata]|uniref:Cell wall mannoprotein PIR1-like C-terminal domain-containing protein n=1 Tax=Thielaviopsis punctulata TaxID=72032 RepID=A0A0F4ZCZ5_9PEZI|nr:hypothetical protein TD95_002371 [Thielaviopsis punctulata]
MKLSAAFMLASSGVAAAQAVTSSIAPDAPIPSGCSTSLPYRFQIAVSLPFNSTGSASNDTNGSPNYTSGFSNYTSDLFSYNPRSPLSKRTTSSCSNNNMLVVSLSNGVLTDAKNRTGYIASNRQFQFDGPPQSGAIFTAGFSVCANNSLALGGSTVWYQCKSGSFSNLYDQDWAEQCSLMHLDVIPCAGETTLQPQNGAQMPPSPSQTTALPICQIGDGQIQAHSTSCADAPAYTPTPTGGSSPSSTLITVPGVTTSNADPVSTTSPGDGSSGDSDGSSGGSGGSSGGTSGGSNDSDGTTSPSPSESVPVTSGAGKRFAVGLLGAAVGIAIAL